MVCLSHHLVTLGTDFKTVVKRSMCAVLKNDGNVQIFHTTTVPVQQRCR